MKNLIFLLLAILAAAWFVGLAGCYNKSGTDPVPPSGRVLEFGTDIPIEGARVTLQDCDASGPLEPVGCFVIDSTNADKNGIYAFDQAGIIVNASKAGFFSDRESEQIVHSGTEAQTDIRLNPFAWLKVRVVNESGAYAFGSAQLLGAISPLITQSKGEEITLTKSVKGNQSMPFLFFALSDPDHYVDTNKVMVIDNTGINIPILWGASAKISIIPKGHDTTSITIIY